jgi:hypothetical protein
MAHIRQSRPDSGLDFQVKVLDSLRVGFGMGAARAEDAQGTPTQSHISPSILVYEEKALHHAMVRPL